MATEANRQLEIDDRFLDRTYRTAIVLGAFVAILLSVYSVETSASFIIGGAISIGLLKILDYVVRRYLTPGKKKVKRAFWLAALIKYPLIMACFYYLVRSGWLVAPALAAGLGLVYVVITLKAFSIVLLNTLEGERQSKKPMRR